ncbi:hypothetical protein BLA29_005129, partial [Euroglyphus maynei]
MIRFHWITTILMTLLWLLIISNGNGKSFTILQSFGPGLIILFLNQALEPEWSDKIFARPRAMTTTRTLPQTTTAFTTIPMAKTYWSISPSQPTTNSFNAYHYDHLPSSTVVHPYRQTSRIPYRFSPMKSSYYNNNPHFARSQPFFISQTESPLSSSDSYDWIRELIQTRLAESKRHLTQAQESMEKLRTKTTFSSLTTTVTTPSPMTTTITTYPTTTTLDHNVDYADQLENRDENLDYFDEQSKPNSSSQVSRISESLKPGQ